MTLQTNIEIDKSATEPLLNTLSSTVAQALGKPESYVMIVLNFGVPMAFAGETSPAAYVELKSLGLPEGNTPALSKVLGEVISEQIDIPPQRVYIEFAVPERHMWGWNGATF